MNSSQETKPGKHEFAVPWNNSDVKLIVETEQGEDIFHVHKLLLSMASTVFERMFESNFKESATREVRLPGKTPKTVLAVLCLIYPHGHIVQEDADVHEILDMAREYDIKRIYHQIDEVLANESVKCKMEHLILADEFDLPKTRTKLIAFCINNVNVLQGNWNNVQVSSRLKILQNKIVKFCDKESPNCAHPDCGRGYCGKNEHLFYNVSRADIISLRELARRFTRKNHDVDGDDGDSDDKIENEEKEETM